MNKNYIGPIFTTLGVIVGGVVWLVIYDLNHTTSIGFDGPAGLMLGISLVVGGFTFGAPSVIYTIRKKHASFPKAAIFFLMSGFAVCILIGLVTSNYAMSKYSDALAEETGCISAEDGRGALCN